MSAPINKGENNMVKKATINQYKYDAKHCRTFKMKLNLTIDADIIQKLTSEPSMQGYIKQLIRADIAGEKPVPVSMCEEAKQMLQEEAGKRSMDVCELAKLIISQWIVHNSIST